MALPAYELAEGRHHLPDVGGRGRVQHYLVLEGALRLLGPLPCIVEGPNLRRRLLPGLFLEQHVVGGVGVEGRVQVDQVHGLVGHVLPQDVQVVAVVEGVGHDGPIKAHGIPACNVDCTIVAPVQTGAHPPGSWIPACAGMVARSCHSERSEESRTSDHPALRSTHIELSGSMCRL